MELNVVLDKCIKRIKRLLYFIHFHYKSFGKKSLISSPLYISNRKYISIGENVTIYKNARIECFDKYCDNIYKPNLVIEDDVTIGYNFQCLVTDDCVIGKNTLIAANVLISTENHGMSPDKPYGAQPLISKPVNIGANCWIGDSSIILPGVKIGDNCIIGAGSIVTKNVDDFSIVVGSPARVIKKYDFEKKEWINI